MKKMLVIAAMVVAAVVASAQERKVVETLNVAEGELVMAIVDADEVTLIEKNFKNFGGVEGWNMTVYTATFKGEINGEMVEVECSSNEKTYNQGKANIIWLTKDESGKLVVSSVYYVELNN